MRARPRDTREGRQRTLGELAREMRPRMRRLLRGWGVPDDDADDLIQQTLLGLVRCRDRVREPEAWIVGATRKSCLMYFRTRRRQVWRAVDDSTLEWLAVPERPVQEGRLLRREVGAIATRIPERYRSVLRLRFGLGCEAGEVARRLGYRRSSIGKVTMRGIEALRGEVTASPRPEAGPLGPPGAAPPPARPRPAARRAAAP